MDLARLGIVEGVVFADGYRIGELLGERTARILRLNDRASGVLTLLELPPAMEARFRLPYRGGTCDGVMWAWARGVLAPGVGWAITPETASSSLDDLLEEGPLPPSRAIPLLRSLVEAIQAVHETGEILLNLRPSVIRVVPGWNQDRVRIPCASWLMGPEAGQRLGGYCAPDVAWSEIGPACDQYSLGVIAYEVLQGTPPHNPEAPPGERTQIAVQVDGPPALNELVVRLLAEAPARRFPSFDEVELALAEITGTLPKDEESYGSFTPIISQRRSLLDVPRPAPRPAPPEEAVIAPPTDTILGLVVIAFSVGTAALGLSYALLMMW